MATPMHDLLEFIRLNAVKTETEVKPGEVVSVQFFNVAKADDSIANAEQMARLIENARSGAFADISFTRLQEGPSYIELGGWLGDQGIALLFMGLGAILGLWEVMTPSQFGLSAEEANAAAGSGYVLIMPKPEGMIADLAAGEE